MHSGLLNLLINRAKHCLTLKMCSLPVFGSQHVEALLMTEESETVNEQFALSFLVVRLLQESAEIQLLQKPVNCHHVSQN